MHSESYNPLFIDALLFGGGISLMMAMAIIVVLYFRLTRKYDTMFPEQCKIFPSNSLIGLLAKTAYYTGSSAFKNFAKLKRNQAYYYAYNKYDFYRNSSALDKTLAYVLIVCIVCGLGSALIIFTITRILEIKI